MPAPGDHAWLPRGELGPDAHDFSEALKLHRLLDAIEKATGRRQAWTEPL
ncbi:hypothetical protein HV824_35420 [Myxococcus sp. AM009]|nr:MULTISPECIES: hypothetical protein [unclassified Myxococcus]NVJ03360.1 hypothetical protein [Myxococcus sp. AM009]NVJ13620.1 hypothetical protein [Myxococcus sp. AM010]